MKTKELIKLKEKIEQAKQERSVIEGKLSIHLQELSKLGFKNETSMSRWLTRGDENLITVMPECFYRASSVFCDTGENKKTLDSRLKTAGMTILIKEVFSGEIEAKKGVKRERRLLEKKERKYNKLFLKIKTKYNIGEEK